MRLKILSTESKHYVCDSCTELTDNILKISQSYSDVFLCVDCLKKGVNLTLEVKSE